MGTKARPFAIVTGASSGIGFELAKIALREGHDLLVAADSPAIHQAVAKLGDDVSRVQAIAVDLATADGVRALLQAAGERPIDLLFANAGHGLGHGFLDQSFEDVAHVIDTNITGTLRLLQPVARAMRMRGAGRILITGSIAGFMPGTFQAVYNGTKAFIDSFSIALRAEMKDTGVTVTCLMPGPTDTDFFARADLLDTKVGQDKKQDPAEVAEIGYKAMMAGEADVVAGWKNKLQAAVAHVLPAEVLAEQHRKMAAPGTGTKS